ncbi:MAG: uroporphyrinogen-III synthase [Candidatus Promineifilaceae bacterium]
MLKPLQGKRIVITRSQEQAEALSDRLTQLGARPILCPTVQFVPLLAEPLEKALRQLGRYDWLIFTSGNAVDYFFQRLAAIHDLGANGPEVWPRVAASGPATAQKLREHQLEPAFIPDELIGERLAVGLGDLAGQRVLLPRAKIGRPELVDLLRQQGAIVDEIPLYDTIAAAPDPQALAELARGFDAVTFTSPSTVRNFLQILEEAEALRSRLDRAVIACLGPVTAGQATACGLTVHIIAAEYTADGLAQALADYFQGRPT